VTAYEPYESDEARGWSPVAVALIAILVLLLGLGGAIFGIQAANRGSAEPPASPVRQEFPTASPQPPASPSPTTAPSQTAAPDTFGVPDVTTADFQTARTKLRSLKLGWQLVFEGGDPADASVRATEPAAGTPVRKGTTIKIFVRGAAPLATVPEVKGKPCAEAAGLIVEQGLYPAYDTGRDGTVLNQTPAATDPPASHWNDQVHIGCATG
jgi:hypothetical protein